MHPDTLTCDMVEENWEDEEVVEESQGWKLHLSSKAASGYFGVYRYGRRYTAEPRMQNLGVFDTAVAAAVAVSRFMAETAAPQEDLLLLWAQRQTPTQIAWRPNPMAAPNRSARKTASRIGSG